MAWCKAVELGKASCKGRSDKSTIFENSGLSEMESKITLLSRSRIAMIGKITSTTTTMIKMMLMMITSQMLNS
jgi:hypothetical protein